MSLLLAGVLLVNDDNEICLLYRKDHQHYETPGGKVDPTDHPGSETPTFEQIRNAAQRELSEELGQQMVYSELAYFGAVDFAIPDGRRAVATKFLCKFEGGAPKVGEPETFSHFKFIPITELESYPLSPDLKLLLPRLVAYFKRE